MICNNNKVLFYHIPRTGGSTIEVMFTGYDWAYIDHEMKHPSIEDFKSKYQNVWDEYFKFTIVRNPFEWVRSMFSIGRCPSLDFKEYCTNLKFDTNLTPKGFKYEDIRGQTFSEILNIEFDKIFRFEDLVSNNFSELNDIFDLKFSDVHSMRYETDNPIEKPEHTEETYNIIKTNFKEDFEKFYPELIDITYEDVKNNFYLMTKRK